MVDLFSTLLNGAVTLGAAFGGFALAGRNQRAGDERAAARERTQHTRDVAIRLAEETHREQLELLRTVQEELHEVTRNLVEIIQADLHLVELGADSSVFPSGLGARDQEARIRLRMHGSRILDDEVRALVEGVNASVAPLLFPSMLSLGLTVDRAREEETRRLGLLLNLANPAIERAGKALRQEAQWRPPAA